MPLSAVSPFPLTVSQVALGWDFTCVLVNGRVYCFGSNERGQLGDSTKVDRPGLVETRLPQGVARAGG